MVHVAAESGEIRRASRARRGSERRWWGMGKVSAGITEFFDPNSLSGTQEIRNGARERALAPAFKRKDAKAQRCGGTDAIRLP
jgi:hypothetical protein